MAITITIKLKGQPGNVAGVELSMSSESASPTIGEEVMASVIRQSVQGGVAALSTAKLVDIVQMGKPNAN